MTDERPKKDLLDRTFQVSVVIKGIDGGLEIIGGFLLLLIKLTTLNYAIVWLTEHELIEDPSDLFANALLQVGNNLSIHAKIFGAAYLLLHGFIKIALVWALLKDKRWAYPTAIIFLMAFVFYQSYRLTYHYSLGLLLLTIFDMAIIFLTYREYQRLHTKAVITS